jgi:hypothetical protein
MMNKIMIWDMMPCSLVNRHLFGGIFYLHLQGRTGTGYLGEVDGEQENGEEELVPCEGQ